jgi:tetratricopeptide (TPR) repeat protein
MAKKVLAASGISLLIVLAIVVVVLIATKAWTDVASDFEQAEQYKQDRQYEQAAELYEAVATDYPDSNYAQEAQRNVEVLELLDVYLSAEEGPVNDKTLHKVLDDIGDAGMLAVHYHIALRYEKSQRYEEAVSVYQELLRDHSDTDYGLQSQRNLVNLYISLADDPNAQDALKTLIADFSWHSGLPGALYKVATRFEKYRIYDQSTSLYQYILDSYSDPNEFGWYTARAQLGIPKDQILSYIDAMDHNSAFMALDDLMVDFNDHKYLPDVIYRVGLEYYRRAFELENEGFANDAQDHFQNAVSILEIVIDDHNGSDAYPKACYSSGDCYRKIGDYAKSIQCYQKVVDEHPDFRTAYNAQFLVGHNYERMKKEGLLSKPEADPLTKAAYEQLLQAYPDCAFARYAKRWLSRYKRN